jgi:hypothetical protein
MERFHDFMIERSCHELERGVYAASPFKRPFASQGEAA